MICMNCQRIDLRAHPEHAKGGLGRCALEKQAGKFKDIERERDCTSFLQAEPEVIETRQAWWKKVEEKRKAGKS